jgi:NAD(P)-dependent dehydrogenase (short-subunit alcohol dehydrogenase family)
VDLGLNGKCALVTGGSRGIGRAIVLGLASNGASVAACYTRESEDVQRLRSDLDQLDGKSYLTQADVSDAGSVAQLVSEAAERLGRIDVLINNAGVVSHRPLVDLELEEWRRVLDVNLTGAYLVTKATLPAMPAGGSIVNISSAVGMRGMVGRTHYTASKAGMIGFTRSLCKEVGPRGIRANIVAPGIIETDQVAGLTDEQRQRYGSLAALNRLGRPEEIANLVLFLASDLSSFISGQTINADGGI